jgi:death-on-curing protein
MIIWLEKPLILTIHARQIAEHGGDAALREEGLLESALARPLQLDAYGEPSPDIAELAAALAYGLARNHPFVDGNKRTAHVAYRVFLAVNSVELLATEEDKYIAMMALAEGKLSEREFAEWLRPRLQLARRNEAHEPRPAYKTKPKRAAKKTASAL